MVGIKELAQKTGFSITTVSRALAEYSDVSAETRAFIRQTAREIGYQPNEVARQLRRQRSNTLGLIIPTYDHSFSEGFFSQLLHGIGDAAGDARYDVLISARSPGDDELEAYKRIVGGNRVDGIILARTRQHDPRIAYLKQVGHPFVVSGRTAPDEIPDFPYIDVDSQAGIYAATQHLIAHGHRQIGLILPPPDVAYTDYRRRGYADALSDAGIAYQNEWVFSGDLRRSGGYQGMYHLLDHHPTLTAVVCSNDLMALGAMQAAQVLGRIVGRDIAVVGFDDLFDAEYAHPPLTTVRQPIYEIGRRLVDLLIGIIQGHPPQETQILLPTELIVRESCGTHIGKGG